MFNKLVFEKKHNIIYNLKIINKSIEIKNKIVLIDKKENKERKALNFGHTLGHAIESFFLNTNKRLLTWRGYWYWYCFSFIHIQ